MRHIFSAFDLFPSPKGAATHIARCATGMANHFGDATLFCIGNPGYPAVQQEGAITIIRHLGHHPNFLQRTEGFADFLNRALDRAEHAPKVIHFRDIWSGMPLCFHPKSKNARLIFEVNGLPSIELAYHYPGLLQNRGLLDRFVAWENTLIQRADAVLTISEVTRRLLVARGADAEKVRVIPNGAEVGPSTDVEVGAPQVQSQHDPFILYVGTLAPWQGVQTLLQAMALLRRESDMGLLIVASTRKHLKVTMKHIRKLGLDDRVTVRIGLSREAVARLYRDALFSVAPLTRCDRNELQGCSPLKVLESMGQGTPVLAADLPVIREIVTHRKDGWLFTPDSPRSLAGGICALLDSPSTLAQMSRSAAETVSAYFSDPIFHAKLDELYTNCLG